MTVKRFKNGQSNHQNFLKLAKINVDKLNHGGEPFVHSESSCF